MSLGFPPFGEIVFVTQFFGKTQSLKLCPLYLFVFLTHFNPNIWISSFTYSIVKFHLASLLWLNLRCFTWALPVGASRLVGLDGLEPSTSRLSGARSSHLSYRPVFYSLALWFVPLRRSARFRTINSTSSSCWTSHDLRLRYFSNRRLLPLLWKMVEMKGFEPLTPCLQGRCSPNWATPPLGCISGLF